MHEHSERPLLWVSQRGDSPLHHLTWGWRSARVGAQLLGTVSLTQFHHDLTLDLANTLPRETEKLTDLVESARLTVVEAVAKPNDLLLAFVERSQHSPHVGVKEPGDDSVLGRRGLG